MADQEILNETEVAGNDASTLPYKVQLFWHLHDRMMKEYYNSTGGVERRAAETLAWKLLMYEDLPSLIRVGCHMVLSCARDGSGVEHNQEAIAILHGLPDDIRPAGWLERAEMMLDEARAELLELNQEIEDEEGGDAEDDGDDDEEDSNKMDISGVSDPASSEMLMQEGVDTEIVERGGLRAQDWPATPLPSSQGEQPDPAEVATPEQGRQGTGIPGGTPVSGRGPTNDEEDE